MAKNRAFDIRRLVRDDAAIYRTIRLEALERHPEAFGASHEDEAARDLDAFADRLADGVVFGGFEGTALYGVAGYFVHNRGSKVRHKATLVGMYVREAARGTGLANQLVDSVVTHAASHVELLHLTVNTANAAACRLYERCGFERFAIERRSLKVDGRYYDEALMVMELSKPS